MIKGFLSLLNAYITANRANYCVKTKGIWRQRCRAIPAMYAFTGIGGKK
jgi:hypothetical protein